VSTVLQIATHTSDNLAPDVAERIAETLCRPGSEMQQVFREIGREEYDEPLDAGLRIAVALRLDEDGAVPIGWAAVNRWSDAIAVQAWVFPNYRQRGLASALVSALTVLGDVPLDEAHVFNERFVSIARRAGFRAVNLWAFDDGQWVKR
jgi:GNAT superfamily N-acetyltransferase